MRLPFKNACWVFFGCVLCGTSVWIPFIACRDYGLCSDMNAEILPLLIGILMLCAGSFIILNWLEAGE